MHLRRKEQWILDSQDASPLAQTALTLKTHLMPILYTIADLPVQCFGCEEQ